MTDHTRDHRGPGLARGPALILGAILAAFGLILFLKTGDTPTDGFPDGDAAGPTFLGFETNGWTAWFTTCAGALLLFGAAQHLLAKAISLLVGLALGACAIIAAIDGDVLGLAAANFWTELGWGIAAVLLVLNVLSPRADHDDRGDYDDGRRGRRGRGFRRRSEPATTGPTTSDRTAVTDRDRDARTTDGSTTTRTTD